MGRHVALSLLLAAACVELSGGGASENPAASTAPTAAPAPQQKPLTLLDLRADTNKDGELTAADDDRDYAIFLANLDDDTNRCPKSGRDSTLYKCFDAADDVVNGDDDLQDFARLAVVPWPDAKDGVTATLSVDAASAGKVHVFKTVSDGHVLLGADETLSTAELRAGVELLLEGTDVVRDDTVWSGSVELTLTATSGEKDEVRLRVAPVISFHHLLAAQEIFATHLVYDPDQSQPFLTDLKAAVTAANVPNGLTEIAVDDQWTQDFFETGYMSMPGKGGGQHVLLTAYRSANQARGGNDTLRSAGKFVYTTFRGKDHVGLQQYSTQADPEMDSLNSFGNFETVPPYAKGDVRYPLGRVLRGATKTWHPDQSFMRMVDSQKVQPAIEIDTSWLSVGHVDETMSFVRAESERGWVLLVNDARLAKKILEDAQKAGHGATKMFVGLSWGRGQSAEMTIDQVLMDQDVMAASTSAAVEVDAQLAKVKLETGLQETEIIRVPYLHEDAYGASVAFQPGTVNGIYLSDTVFAAPDPHGPVINGKDIMKEPLEKALAALGISVKWVEEWDLYHTQMGEAHCGSNALRAIPSVKWWETGR